VYKWQFWYKHPSATLFAISLLLAQASAVTLLLDGDNECLLGQDDPEGDGTCFSLDYSKCYQPSELFDSAIGSLDEENWPDRPVLRAYNQQAGENPDSNPCYSVRTQVELEIDASNPGNFSCLEGPADDAFHGFQIDIVPPTARSSRTGVKAEGGYVSPNGWGIFEDGSIYGTYRDSEAGKLFGLSRGNMTVKEKRAFIRSHDIVNTKAHSPIFRL
jgi:hypothetical protein